MFSQYLILFFRQTNCGLRNECESDFTTTYAAVKIRPEKKNSGIEPMTSAIPVQGSTN